jgi:hypothetical protein
LSAGGAAKNFRRNSSLALTFRRCGDSAMRKIPLLEPDLSALAASAQIDRLRPLMTNRRTLQRTRVMRNAKILVPRHSPVVHCTVNDITNAGACLTLASTYGLPATFDLTFEHGRTRRSCRVIWRTHDRLGVTFEDPAAEG